MLHHLFALDQSARLRLAVFRANAPRPAFADAAAARTDACLLPFTVTGRPVTRRAVATDFVRAVRLARAIALPDSPRIFLQSAAQQGTSKNGTQNYAPDGGARGPTCTTRPTNQILLVQDQLSPNSNATSACGAAIHYDH